MTDLISRQAVIEAIGEVHPLDYNGQAILTRLKELPTIDPVRHGKWIPGREIAREMISDTIMTIIYEDWKCSDCGCTVEEGKPGWNYCPNCGAKMDGGEG